MFKNIIATLGILGTTLLGGNTVENEALTPHNISAQENLWQFEKMVNELKVEENELLSEPNKTIEIVLTEKNESGFMFYDDGADYEPNIFVSNETVEHWGIDDMTEGQSIVGIFDTDGWELFGFVKGSLK